MWRLAGLRRLDGVSEGRGSWLATKLYYGFGSVAYGVKDNGFAYFLLLYYNQVLGLPAQWVGAAIMVALIFDAFSDPVVGYASDNLHSRWGRRHPFMYGAVIPVALSYFMLWNPPSGLEGEALFLYLVAMAIVVRTCITFYEIPSSSLVAELTDDYDERTSMLSYRYFFGWWGGLTMALTAYFLLLRPTAEYPIGQLNPDGWRDYGLVASCVIVVSVRTDTFPSSSSRPRSGPSACGARRLSSKRRCRTARSWSSSSPRSSEPWRRVCRRPSTSISTLTSGSSPRTRSES
jgi:Na+/melibiose symporter-like transporter